ncbi:DUF3325 domain-containing protein [Solilutibacter pythonis]|nr:DUF3325 domain-containing protein [Lysobacter pythonis]
MMQPLLIAIAFSGLSLLCLGMERHHPCCRTHDWAAAWPRTALRLAGWWLTGSSLALAMWMEGPATGLLHWLGIVTAAGLLLALGLLPYRAHWIAPMLLLLPVLGGAASLLTGMP